MKLLLAFVLLFATAVYASNISESVTSVSLSPPDNITFVKEVTLNVEAWDGEAQAETYDLLSAGLKMLDPVFHFFDQMWHTQPQDPSVDA